MSLPGNAWGKAFTAVSLLSLFTHFLPQSLHFDQLLPLLGAVVLNLTLPLNHRPGRYMAI